MIRSTSARLAAIAVGLAATASFAGCGNGVEVRGPAEPPSPSLTSPTPEHSADPSDSPDAADNSPTAGPTDPDSPDSSDDSADDPDASGGSNGDDSGNKGDNGDKGDKGDNGGDESGGDQHNGNATATCSLSDLSIGVRSPAGGGAAGSQYVLLTFANTSSGPCTLYGYPGVSFVGHQNGTQLGKPAVRDKSRSAQQVRLAPDSTKSALVKIADAGNFDPEECQPTTADGFRVYPPGSYTAAYVPFKAPACQGKVAQLTVYPVGTKS